MAYMNLNYDYPPEWDEPEIDDDELIEDVDVEEDEEWVEDPHSESLWEQRP